MFSVEIIHFSVFEGVSVLFSVGLIFGSLIACIEIIYIYSRHIFLSKLATSGSDC